MRRSNQCVLIYLDREVEGKNYNYSKKKKGNGEVVTAELLPKIEVKCNLSRCNCN
jgi:hypothetical protein